MHPIHRLVPQIPCLTTSPKTSNATTIMALVNRIKKDAFIAQMEATVNTYANNHQDPYTRLVAQSIYTLPQDQEKFVGIGIRLQHEGMQMRIIDVFSSGPAHGKIFPNDLLIGIEINGQDIYFETLVSPSISLNYLSGKIGDSKILILKDPDGITYKVEIIYQEILTPTALSKDLMDDQIAYLKINSFSGYVKDVTEGTSKVFADVLFELERTILNTNPETKTLIIDLRDNPGGALTSLSNRGATGLIPGIVQQLLVRTDLPAFSLQDKNGNPSVHYGGLDQAKPYAIKILVNENSASAAEVLAAALQTIGNYDLYGNYTYGKGVYQNTRFLQMIDDVNYSLTYTEGKWFYGNGLNVEVNPLDVEIIEKSGFHAISMPIYGGRMTFNNVYSYLSAYQMFLNTYYDLSLRTDGYFDQNTKDSVTRFQTEMSLEVTGEIDRATARVVHLLYIRFIEDLTYDYQLQTLIDLIKDRDGA